MHDTDNDNDNMNATISHSSPFTRAHDAVSTVGVGAPIPRATPPIPAPAPTAGPVPSHHTIPIPHNAIQLRCRAVNRQRKPRVHEQHAPALESAMRWRSAVQVGWGAASGVGNDEDEACGVRPVVIWNCEGI